MDLIFERAKKYSSKIILPEPEDKRILKAAVKASKLGIAKPILVGSEKTIFESAKDLGLDINAVKIVEPDEETLDRYAEEYLKIRGMPEKKKRVVLHIVKRSLYFGAMMVHLSEADGMVAGAVNTTANVIRAASLVIGLQEGISTPSSFFLMEIPRFEGGEDGNLLFADCAVNIDPSPDELAEIAIATARSAKWLLDWEPRVAMLSFSTKGSASHELVDKVVKATNIAKTKEPNLLIDGELQADAALIPSVAKRKVKGGSPVAGKANILIFPDLNAGNIAYKLVQRLAKANAYGPILQGFSRPVSDLSRGATVEDIVGVIGIISVIAGSMSVKR